jgi:hypothetical protein
LALVAHVTTIARNSASVKLRCVPSVAAAEVDPSAPEAPRLSFVVSHEPIPRIFWAVPARPTTRAWLASMMVSMSRFSSLPFLTFWRANSSLAPYLWMASCVVVMDRVLSISWQ